MHSITHAIGGIFAPIYHLVGWMLAFLYDHVVPNYAVAITLLTIIIMGILTPFTAKSYRSMSAMQRIQPEMKKLQQKYKGAENRQTLNDEMMKLYKEEGVNPLGSCLPMLLQMPFLVILYGVIKGLAYTVTSKAGVITSEPRYIPHSGTMYENLIHSVGHINVWGMDLSLHAFPLGTHSTALAAVPFFLFAAAAVGLQYLQMAQINNRNRKKGQALPSQQVMMQRVLPIFFAYFYLVIPAAVVLYMIISSGIRIITQYYLGRSDLAHVGARESGLIEIPGSKPSLEESKDEPSSDNEKKAKSQPSSPSRPKSQPSTNNRAKNQSRPAAKSQSQPRSKAKRKRKAR